MRQEYTSQAWEQDIGLQLLTLLWGPDSAEKLDGKKIEGQSECLGELFECRKCRSLPTGSKNILL